MWRKNVELQRTQSGLLPYDELPVDYNFNETKRNDTGYSLPSIQSTVSFVSSNPQFCIHGHIEEIRQNRRIIYARAYTRLKKKSKCTKNMKSNNKTDTGDIFIEVKC